MLNKKLLTNDIQNLKNKIPFIGKKSDKNTKDNIIKMEKEYTKNVNKSKQSIPNNTDIINKNRKRYISIKYIENFKKTLETTDIEELNRVIIKNNNLDNPIKNQLEQMKNNVKEIEQKREEKIKEELNKIEIDNSEKLYNWYLNNNENGLIPNKKQTSEMLEINIEKVKRYNKKLKEENKLITKGKQIYLIDIIGGNQ